MLSEILKSIREQQAHGDLLCGTIKIITPSPSNASHRQIFNGKNLDGDSYLQTTTSSEYMIPTVLIGMSGLATWLVTPAVLPTSNLVLQKINFLSFPILGSK
jgi:hypothetical protein